MMTILLYLGVFSIAIIAISGLPRLLIILIGHIWSAFACALYTAILSDLRYRSGDVDLMRALGDTPLMALLFSLVLIAPAMPIIIVADAKGYRNPLYYILAWTFAGLVASMIPPPLPVFYRDAFERLGVALWIGGAVCGLAYWSVAGRLTPARPKDAERVRRPRPTVEQYRNFYRRP